MLKIPGTIRLALLLFLVSLAGLAQAQIANINDAINKAGSLRYTAHRLGKVYIQIGMGVDAERSRRILDSTVGMYDQRVVELKNYAPTPEIRESYIALEKAWSGYRSLLTGARPSQEGARRIMAVSDEVVTIANKATAQLAAHSGSVQGGLVNVSGRQRMLSQRLAKYYQAQAWGVAPANVQAEISQARAEFVQKLDELSAAPVNTQAIKDELALARQQWMFFDNAFNGRDNERKANSLNVATTSERILEAMDSVVGLYEKLPR